MDTTALAGTKRDGIIQEFTAGTYALPTVRARMVLGCGIMNAVAPLVAQDRLERVLAHAGMPERARRALEQVLTFRSTSAIEVYETLREALASDPGDA